jgi:beta-lactamase class D
MSHKIFLRLITSVLFTFSFVFALSAEENFLLMNGITDDTVFEVGPHIDKRISPCSTFKITLEGVAKLDV